METTTQTQASPRTPSAKLSPLKQHPVISDLHTAPDATRTIFLNHPSARWSSSPASSPRIVDPSPVRRSSVYPALSDTMQKGLELGADFFDDGSSGSEWEDSEEDMTQTLSDNDGLGLRSNASRGRSRRRSGMTALPPFKQPPARHSGMDARADENLPSPVDAHGGRRARPISLRPLSKDNVHVVHNSRGGTPRNSLRSSISVTSTTAAGRPKSITDANCAHTKSPKKDNIPGRHRENTSESVLADSIINAHVRTLIALESLNLSPSSSLMDPNSKLFPQRPSFTDERHIKLSPNATTSADDHDRPAHLPSHLVRTPYPFSTPKEFPKPKSRPRSHGVSEGPHSGDTHGFVRLDSAYGEGVEKKEYTDRKGKHVLGFMASEGEYDLRSRLERNEDAQGIIRSRAGSGRKNSESAIWLSLERKSCWRAHSDQQPRKLFKVTVPCSLTTSGPGPESSKDSPDTLDFDDMFLAQRLRAAHAYLAGNWAQRTVSARTLRSISLAQVGTWSGVSAPRCVAPTTSGLLAIGAGLDADAESHSPFTEDSVMALYRHPSSGKARYTWVHWARRIARSNASRRGTHDDMPDSLTAVQFAHGLSVARVLSALTLMLVLSVLAALLWVFLGPGGTGWRTAVQRQRSERVGGGMAVGIFVLLLEGVGFVGWVWSS
ncbi:hypothetical protein CC86DRAFT_471913 [Ophiobolus disseminans]|uniref:Uncharacterized protein n=1 Tax=Ophiobolus disseminans TaxID=1469910 RepID=A0A6A6ZFR5_9PLEO|nr:hypothetical protein CC86DRAFT_471913 [Ophiobolus disseminans]